MENGGPGLRGLCGMPDRMEMSDPSHERTGLWTTRCAIMTGTRRVIPALSLSAPTLLWVESRSWGNWTSKLNGSPSPCGGGCVTSRLLKSSRSREERSWHSCPPRPLWKWLCATPSATIRSSSRSYPATSWLLVLACSGSLLFLARKRFSTLRLRTLSPQAGQRIF